jgi:hypothetical protein
MVGNALRDSRSEPGRISGWAVILILFAAVAFASFAVDLSLRICPSGPGMPRHTTGPR